MNKNPSGRFVNVATKQQYLVRLGAKQLIEVSPSEFARLRGMKRLFRWSASKPTRLRLDAAYVGWLEGNEMKFAEKHPNPDRSRSPLVDSCVLMERKVAPHHPSYIQDGAERHQAIERQYL